MKARDGTAAVALEPPIQAMIDATNDADSARLLAAFADDAVLTDWGRTFSGKQAIARWNADENIGTHNRLRVTDVRRTGRAVQVRVDVSGGGYNGEGTLTFHVDGPLITRLDIT